MRDYKIDMNTSSINPRPNTILIDQPNSFRGMTEKSIRRSFVRKTLFIFLIHTLISMGITVAISRLNNT